MMELAVAQELMVGADKKKKGDQSFIKLWRGCVWRGLGLQCLRF